MQDLTQVRWRNTSCAWRCDRDRHGLPDANLIFNQSLMLSLAFTAFTLLAGAVLGEVGVLLAVAYFAKLEKFVRIRRDLLAPRVDAWKRIPKIDDPPGGEHLLFFVLMSVVFWSSAIRRVRAGQLRRLRARRRPIVQHAPTSAMESNPNG